MLDFCLHEMLHGKTNKLKDGAASVPELLKDGFEDLVSLAVTLTSTSLTFVITPSCTHTLVFLRDHNHPETQHQSKHEPLQHRGTEETCLCVQFLLQPVKRVRTNEVEMNVSVDKMGLRLISRVAGA